MYRRKKTEKLAVVVTGTDKVEQIISSSFLQSGTGSTVAETVFKSLQEWTLQHTIVAKCYDTTRVNSGVKNGAAVILEQLLGRMLFDFPCRHHIYELVLQAAYVACFDQATSSPENCTFKLFQDEWDRLDQNSFSKLPDGINSLITKFQSCNTFDIPK